MEYFGMKVYYTDEFQFCFDTLGQGLFQNQNSNPKRLPFSGLDGYNHSAVASNF